MLAMRDRDADDCLKKEAWLREQNYPAEIGPGWIKHAEAYKTEAARLRALLPTLPD